MSYIKISDPSIVDLSAWHQVIAVVNQHSDTIDAMNNTFGVGSVPDYNADEMSHQYSAGSQLILYGRGAAYNSVSGHTDTASNGHIWYGQIDFPTPAFGANPIVTATLQTGGGGSPVSGSNKDAILTVTEATKDHFKYRIWRASGVDITLTTYINWIAIGSK